MTSGDRRGLLVSKGWVQAVVLVVLFGFFVMGLLAYRTYTAKPPMPQRVVDPAGRCSTRRADVRRGQQVFLHNGLMEYGSVFGHGAYLGPDYTADYLRRASDFVRARVRRAALGQRGAADGRGLPHQPLRRAHRHAHADRRAGRGAPPARRRTTARFFSEPTTKHGLRPEAITDRTELAQLTAFFGWTAWAGVDRAARATTTPTRTTGRRSRASTTARRRTWSCGACSR